MDTARACRERGIKNVAVTAGYLHSICVLEGGRVCAWGYAEDATLGLELADNQQLTPLEHPELRIM